MRLLISNDDGIFAMGIRILANTLAAAGHEVMVVCPDRERSATGHGLTLHKPIRAEIIESIFHPAVTAWACSGTPSDCVKLAIGALCDPLPDFVLSGINHGANLGTDILYSGTVSAAMEGVIEGDIPSIALSLANYTHPETVIAASEHPANHPFQPAAYFALSLLHALQTHPLPEALLLNVNIPAVPADQIAGVTIARQCKRRYRNLFEKRLDPRGKTYYWLAGEIIEEQEMASQQTAALANLPIDVRAIAQHYITLTPLSLDLTLPSQFDLLQTTLPHFRKQLSWSPPGATFESN
ncbi:5'/3'-nucleotidase SurE [Trichothermofontia sp.]